MNKILPARYLSHLFLMVCIWFSPLLAMSQTIHYVSPGGAGTGTSWTNAFGDIQTAINSASSGDIIYIAKGQYTPSATILITKSIKLYGGFSGTESNPDERIIGSLHTTNSTEIIGQRDRAAVYINPTLNTDEITIDGIGISGAGRSAIYISKGNHLITQCKFENNLSPSGGAIYIVSGDTEISNCIFNENQATYDAFTFINRPIPSNWELINYTSSVDGYANYANGTNVHGDKEKAMFFNVSGTSDNYMKIVDIGFGVASTQDPTKIVPIKIYDGTSGTPGSLLGSTTITMGQIVDHVADNLYTRIYFPSNIQLPVSKKFFVSVDISNLNWPNDKLSIWSNRHGQTVPTAIWEKQANDNWYRYDHTSSWEANISLLIHPLLSDVPFEGAVDGLGGAVYQTTTGAFKLSNNVFSKNRANYGGALFNWGEHNTVGTNQVFNNTFYKNAAEGEGGAIYNYRYSGTVYPVLNHNIFWENTAADANDIQDNSDNIAIAKHNITQGYQVNINSNLQIDPLFRDAENNDFALEAISPAIDAGNNALYPGLTANSKDLAGNDRVYFLAEGGIIDIGAFEAAVSKPVLTVSGGSTDFIEGKNIASLPVSVDSLIGVSDLDNSTLVSATVSISGNFSAAEDILSFANDGLTMGNILSSYNPSTGVLSLSSSEPLATLAQWQAALRSVKYTNSSDDLNTVDRSITFIVNDGLVNSDAVTKVVTVTAVNDAPVNSVPGDQEVKQDAVLVFNTTNTNLISVSDVDAGANPILVTLEATNGLLTLSGTVGLTFTIGDGVSNSAMTMTGNIASINQALDGLSFTPTAGYNGPASIEIITNDQGFSGGGGAQADMSTIAITVKPINPKVISVGTSTPDGSNKAGEDIVITVSFDQVVIVAMTGTQPAILLEKGTIDRYATYVSGSNSTQLIFNYTIQAGDQSADLDYQSINALVLNGSTIKNSDGDDAVLTLPAVGGANSLAGQHDIVVDTEAPIVTGVVDGMSYNTDLTISFNEGIGKLNGNSFSSGAVVSDSGIYTLIVTDAAGNSTTVAFVIDKIPPGVPANLLAVGHEGKIELTWDANEEADFKQYILYVKPKGGTKVFLATLTKGTESYNYSLLPNGSGYEFFLSTEDNLGNLSAEVVASATTLKTQAITFGMLAAMTYGDSDRTLSATSNSGLAVSYVSSEPSIAEVYQDANDGGKWKVKIKTIGEITITASQAGNQEYLSATSLSRVLVINKASLTVSADAKTKVYGAADPSLTYTVMATELKYDDLPSVVTGGLERVSGENVGSYKINNNDLTASNYSINYIESNLVITKAVITGIIFDDARFVYDGTVKSLAIKGTLPAGASVSYTNNSRTNAGKQTVTAIINNGTNYENLILTAELTITKAEAVITAVAIQNHVSDGKVKDVVASANHNESILTYTPQKGYINGGTYSITIVAPESENYNQASTTVQLVINSAEFSGLSFKDKTVNYNGKAQDVVLEGAPAGSTIDYTINGQAGNSQTDAGTYTVTAKVTNPNYITKTMTVTLVIKKAYQQITFEEIGTVSREANRIPLKASSTSGLPLTITSDYQLVATIDGNDLLIHRIGTVRLTATQAGDKNHEAAAPVSIAVQVADEAEGPIRVHPALSPNGDGINDFLVLEGIKDYAENKLQIVTRNGLVVFKIDGYDNDSKVFKGIGNMRGGGGLLPEGTYFYVLEYKDGNKKKVKKGWFVLKV